jgi:precorrin-6Y C5,15-methyltransferase (decarboxylating)
VIECVRLAPWLEAFAVEHDASAAEACRTNAATHGVAVSVVASCAGLPPPDRVFVGGGGLDVLEMAWDRLRSGGILVATHAALDRAATAASTLGNLTSVVANRGRQLPDGGWRLEGTNPVFITWGAKP